MEQISLMASDRDSTPTVRRLERQWAARLTTFRRDGRPVHTPVNIAVDGRRVVFRSYASAWKCRRLGHDSRVILAPCDWRGKPTGPGAPGRARQLEGVEDERAAAAIDAAYPVFQRLLVRTGHRLLRHHTVHFEVLMDDLPVS